MIVAGTGHRPKYMPCQYDEAHEWATKVKNALDLAFHNSNGEIEKVITGMAIGWDTWLAEMAMVWDIPVAAYVPFKGQGSKWPRPAQRRYEAILEAATEIRYTAEEYHRDAFLERDRAMVADADQMFALWNPEAQSGGTYYTVKFAEEKGLTVKNFWPIIEKTSVF